MSHVADIKLKIKSLAALKTACEAIGLKFNENQHTYKWYGRSVGDYPIPAGFTTADLGKCEHALSVPNHTRAYEIGVVRNPKTNEWTLLWDFWSGGFGLEGVVGKNANNLQAAYLSAEATERAAMEGWDITEQTQVGLDEIELEFEVELG